MGRIMGSLWKRRSVGPMAKIFAEDLLPVPRSLKTRTQRGFPHFHIDYGDGTRFGRKANPAKIAGSVRFLHRTQKTKNKPRTPESLNGRSAQTWLSIAPPRSDWLAGWVVSWRHFPAVWV
jgi:hypothetical protein